MDKYECRRRRLQELINTRCGGIAAALARKIEREPSYVARMLYPEGKAGKKRIADGMIELIEQTFDLPRGWLDGISDQDATVTAVSPKKRKLLELFDSLSTHEQNELISMLESKGHSKAIQEIVRMMEATDDNGRLMVLGAAKLTLAQYAPIKSRNIPLSINGDMKSTHLEAAVRIKTPDGRVVEHTPQIDKRSPSKKTG